MVMVILTIMTMEFMMQLGGEAWCAAPVFQSAFLALAKCISCIGRAQSIALAKCNPSLWQEMHSATELMLCICIAPDCLVSAKARMHFVKLSSPLRATWLPPAISGCTCSQCQSAFLALEICDCCPQGSFCLGEPSKRIFGDTWDFVPTGQLGQLRSLVGTKSQVSPKISFDGSSC